MHYLNIFISFCNYLSLKSTYKEQYPPSELLRASNFISYAIDIVSTIDQPQVALVRIENLRKLIIF